MDKSKKMLFCKIFLAIACVFIVALGIKYFSTIIELTLSVDKFRDYIISQGKFGVIAFIFFQVLQIVIAPIPGEVIQVAGGYIYGVPLGMLYTIVGLLLGAVIAFYFTRFMGRDFIKKILSKKNNQWLADIMDSKKFTVILFVVFLIPGLPKDFLIYVAGLTPINPLSFLGILLISRIPWLAASVGLGASMSHNNYTSMIIISAISVIAFLIGVTFKDRIIRRFSDIKSSN
jgi:uncharacterized membrane protein YdjX (TVP38/TMEM64 family)